MNKRNEQILKYIDGSLSEEERLNFEEILANDLVLKKDTEKVKNLISGMKADGEPDTDESYFINMLPEFYTRNEKMKRFVFSKIAYSLSTVAAVILILFLVFKPSSTIDYSNLNELSRSLTDNELNAALKEYADPYSINDLIGTASAKTDSIVSNLVADELDLTSSENKAIADTYLNMDDLLGSINESEANELYAQLINEDIIKGVK